MIKSVVIGCGAISVCHLDSLMQTENALLAAVCDIKEERAAEKAKKYGCAFYTDYKEMIEKEKPDCVHICLPHWLHAPVAVYCLERDINVVLEKPLASTLEGGLAIIAAAEKSKANIAISFQNRYNNTSRRLKEAVDRGELGKLTGASGIVTWYRDRDYYVKSGWRGKWATEGGGVLINQSIHTLDLMQWIMGDIVDIKGHAFTDRYGDINEVEDTATINFAFANGACGVFYATTVYCINSPVYLEVCGDAGRAVLEGSSLVIYHADGRTEKTDNNSVTASGKDYWGNAHLMFIRDFYAKMGNKPFWISPVEAMKTLRILKETYRQSGIGLPGQAD